MRGQQYVLGMSIPPFIRYQNINPKSEITRTRGPDTGSVREESKKEEVRSVLPISLTSTHKRKGVQSI